MAASHLQHFSADFLPGMLQIFWVVVLWHNQYCCTGALLATTRAFACLNGQSSSSIASKMSAPYTGSILCAAHVLILLLSFQQLPRALP